MRRVRSKDVNYVCVRAFSSSVKCSDECQL